MVDVLPRADEAMAFELALGYNLANVQLLINNIRKNLTSFPSVYKGNLKGYGDVYEVEMILTGENGKTARVLTGWIDDTQQDKCDLHLRMLINKGGYLNGYFRGRQS